MENDIIKAFILDEHSPRIFNCPFQDFYNRYVYFANQKGYKPVSKNKLSRFLKKYGFETKVIRNQYIGTCERIIIMPEPILSYLENQLKSQETEKEKYNNERKKEQQLKFYFYMKILIRNGKLIPLLLNLIINTEIKRNLVQDN